MATLEAPPYRLPTNMESLPADLLIERIDWTSGKITGTPEPRTLALFGLGLAGIGFMGRRRIS